MSFQKSMPNTWSDTNVDINLDALSPAGRQSKLANPSMNQLQQVTPSRVSAAGKLKAYTLGCHVMHYQDSKSLHRDS